MTKTATKKTNQVECYFCGCKVDTVDEAIDAGWVPSFFQRSRFQTVEQAVEVVWPVCQCCQDKNLKVELGELTNIE